MFTKTTYKYTKSIYFGLKHERFSNRIHLRIVKLEDVFSVTLIILKNRRKQTLHTYNKHVKKGLKNSLRMQIDPQ